jgi:hypothetical protein
MNLPAFFFYARCWVEDKLKACGDRDTVECTRGELVELLLLQQEQQEMKAGGIVESRGRQ